MKDKSKHGWATDGVKREGRNEPGPHVVVNPDKRANNERQASSGKPPVGTHHSGVKIQKSITKKK
jgi:hypothetical protein